MKLNTTLLSIQIRDITLLQDTYQLKIQPEKEQVIDAGQAKTTILPTFPITKSNSHIYHYFLFDSPIPLLLYLFSPKQNKAIHCFSMLMSEVRFIGNDLSSMKIRKYPILLLEYLNGFYTTADCIEQLSFETESLNKVIILTDLILRPKEISLKSIRTSKSNYESRCKELEYIRSKHPKLQDDLNKLNAKLQAIKAGQDIRGLNEIVKRRQKAEELIKAKNALIRKSIENLKALTETIDERVNGIEKRIAEYNRAWKLKKDALPLLKINRASAMKVNTIYIKKVLSEYSFVFFNKRLCQYITLPPFFNEQFNERTKIRRLTYTEQHERKISLFLGFIVQMIVYLAKVLNVPLRYPLYVHGASSSIVKAANAYIKLYGFSIGNPFEKGFECVKDMMNVLLSYLINKELLSGDKEFKVDKVLIDIVKRGNVNMGSGLGIGSNINDFGEVKFKDNVFLCFIMYNLYFNMFIGDNKHADYDVTFEELQSELTKDKSNDNGNDNDLSNGNVNE